MCLTPELEQTMRTIIREEIDQRERDRRAGRTMYQRVCKDYEEAMRRFDGVRVEDYPLSDGRQFHYESEQLFRCKIRDAIGTLLRAIYQVKQVAKLPLDKEPEIRGFIQAVLTLMEETKGNKQKCAAEGGSLCQD